MNPKEFNKLIKRFLDEAAELRSRKEELYNSEENIFRSFEKCAEVRNKPLPTMILDLGTKHFQSISDMVDVEFPSDFLAEGISYEMGEWDEKFMDLLNYTLKLYASIKQAKES